MALRLNHLVVEGEIDNTRKGHVTGWIKFSDRPDRVTLDLAGNCAPDLAGWRFRIKRLRPAPDWAEPGDSTSLAPRQTGKAGAITAEQRLKEFDCSTSELLAHIRLNEPPPFRWRNALYLEWFSPTNGRVVIQDTRLGVERMGERAFELTADDLSRSRRDAQRELDDFLEDGWLIQGLSDGTGLGFVVRKDEEDQRDRAVRELQEQLDRQGLDLERAVRKSLRDDDQDPDDPASAIHEMELLDAFIDDPSRGCRVRELFDPPLQPTPSRDIPDDRIAEELENLRRLLLSKNVCIHICKHYTPRMAYEWILDVVLDEPVMAQIAQTQIMVNFMTSDDCEQCQREFEEE